MKRMMLILILLMSSLTRAQQKPMLGSQLIIGHPINRGLVGRWLFNEGSGVVTDLVDTRQNGTITGASWGVGPYGNQISFDGSGDYIDANVYGLDAFGAFTYTIRAKWGYVSNKFLLHSKDAAGYRHLMVIHANNTLILWRQGHPGAFYGSSFTKLDANWHHLSVVCNPGQTVPLFYLDGILQTSLGTPGGYGSYTGSNLLRIGGRLVSGYDATADVSDVAIYNRALSPGEIVSLYTNTYLGVDTGGMPIELMAGAMGGEEPPDPTGGQIIRMNIF